MSVMCPTHPFKRAIWRSRGRGYAVMCGECRWWYLKQVPDLKHDLERIPKEPKGKMLLEFDAELLKRMRFSALRHHTTMAAMIRHWIEQGLQADDREETMDSIRLSQ